MKAVYPLKKAEPANLVEPICKYLEQAESSEVAFNFRDNINKINQLRNKVTTLEVPEKLESPKELDKNIAAIEMYVKYAKLMAKHLNWNRDYGAVVEDLNLSWFDSFNPGVKYSKSDIGFDIFCCYYNLGVMYMYKAVFFCM